MNFKRVYTVWTVILLLFALPGCGNNEAVSMEPDTFSKQDMAIFKADNSKERVSYGMSRKAAEKVLGKGTVGLPNSYSYEFGVSVIYRDNKVVSMAMAGEPQGVYRTARGAELGMSKTRIKELYGTKAAIENDKYMDYYYNSESGQLYERAVKEWNSLTGDALRDIQMLSTLYDEAGNARIIILMDGQVANTAQ
ncbi:MULTISPECIES: hypothetical protein [unclassified Paenibacillus]|uniref:hypothetical protein n=1 Tax=unclassified Paenibacillus TaxID=185978 RepID=UPI0003E2AE08|nr:MULTISPECIES: hypothetical protein [unclassified Paenibacillus]ETT53485.1 hypothetical protein C162_07014 [Paenibacillus sp. FSL R7-269]OMF98921.1 hypothetical protein BK147_08845 [Paenibacillus sp. FSL R7-0337]